jgi:hypothetical protein
VIVGFSTAMWSAPALSSSASAIGAAFACSVVVMTFEPELADSSIQARFRNLQPIPLRKSELCTKSKRQIEEA